MTVWEWWWLEDGGQEYEGWAGACASRDDAIKEAQREVPVGARFIIIEARSSTAEKYEGADWVPFLRTRNREVLTNGPVAPEMANV